MAESNSKAIAIFSELVDSLSLQDTNNNKVAKLTSLDSKWRKLPENSVGHIIKDSKLLTVYTSLLEQNGNTTWKKSIPAWFGNIAYFIANYCDVPHLFPEEQFKSLVAAFNMYFIHHKCWAAIYSLRCFTSFRVVLSMLANEEEIWEILKNRLNDENVRAIFIRSTQLESIQLHLMQDKQFILSLLANASEDLWHVLVNIAQHPDSKTMLPPEVMLQASKATSIPAITLCLLLCSDDNLHMVNLSSEWVSTTVELLSSLISTGIAERDNMCYQLLELVLPIANLSILESQKEAIGNKLIPLLLKIICGDLPKDSQYIGEFLARGRQESSRAVWNFAYNESNRALIAAENSIYKLKNALSETDDPILKKNIEGILYMVANPPSSEKQNIAVAPSKGHIMISYNWGNQQTVKRIASSLKANGYNVWLDIEQMAGSTLEAMASAVERAELVLICMSQKYKDSPNCRLEGEYCVNRKVPFVPLMMQKTYKPDGWLGIALGAKLYYDFTDENEWERKIAELITAVGKQGAAGILNAVPVAVTPQKPAISAWNAEEIHSWMKATGISHHSTLFEKHKITGIALEELKHRIDQPSFLKYLQQQWGITEVGEMLMISAAIRKL